jgi:4-aminobutyrate aminotransferase/(S)-3-amino-2-methylpropionate transaminase
LEIFEEEKLIETANSLGKKIRQRFQTLQNRFEIIGDVRGIGPMLALELVKDRVTKEPAADQAKALVKFCYEKGLIILSCGNFSNVIRTLMPLVITDEQLERGLAILEEGLSSLQK